MAGQDAVISTGVDNSALKAGMDQAQSIVAKSNQKLADSFDGLKGNIRGALAGGAFLSLGKGALDAAAKLDSAKGSLTALMGSASLADSEIERLRQTALAPGLDFESAVKGSAALQAAGFSASQARKIVAELGNTLALSGNTSGLSNVVDALVDVKNSGDIADEKIDRLNENSGLLSRALQKAFGSATAAGIRETGASATDLVLKLTEALSTMDRAADNTANKLKNTKDRVTQLQAELGKTLQPLVEQGLEGGGKIAEYLGDKIGAALEVNDILASTLLAIGKGTPIKEAGGIVLDQKAAEYAEQLAEGNESVAASQDRMAETAQKAATAQRDLAAAVKIATAAAEARAAKETALTDQLAEARKKTLLDQYNDVEKLTAAEQDLLKVEKEIKALADLGVADTTKAQTLQIKRESIKQEITSLTKNISEDGAGSPTPDRGKDVERARQTAEEFETARLRFQLEEEMLNLQIRGGSVADKKLTALREELNILDLQKDIMDSQNVSADEALKKARQRIALQNAAAKAPAADAPFGGPGGRRIKGYSNEQREAKARREELGHLREVTARKNDFLKGTTPNLDKARQDGRFGKDKIKSPFADATGKALRDVGGAAGLKNALANAGQQKTNAGNEMLSQIRGIYEEIKGVHGTWKEALR